MNIKEIVSDKKNNLLRDAVAIWSHNANVGLMQAYSGVMGTIQEEFPNYEPYKNFESFKHSYYR